MINELNFCDRQTDYGPSLEAANGNIEWFPRINIDYKIFVVEHELHLFSCIRVFFFPLPGFFRNQFSVVFLDIFNNPLRIVVAAIKWGFLGDWNAYIVFALVSEGQTGQIDVKSDRSWMLTWVADFN